MSRLSPYSGNRRKLVLSIDVGTTFSGMCYAILAKGEVPDIKAIARYPGREDRAGDYRIPSIIYYRKDGSVHSVGAEAVSEDLEMEPEFDSLFRAEWFKLHLRPEHLDSQEMKRQKIPPLPRGKTVVQVLADFLQYMYSCARTYISENHANGELLWNEVKDDIEFVLSHPNGWEGLQQSKMREAAILAELIPDTPAGRDRVRFVSEGEASLQFCVQSGLISDSIKAGESIMVVDAGGGTIDISSYSFEKVAPLAVAELAPPDCVMQGSAMVNIRAQNLLKERLKKSKYGRDNCITTMMEDFDKQVKPLFKPESKRVYIDTRLGGNDPSMGVRNGRLTLTPEEMTNLFRPSLDAIIGIIRKQFQATPASSTISTVFLVGGFSANSWLYTSLKEALDNMGMRLYRPDAHMSKAVAEGSVSYYLDQFISYRVVKATYGTSVVVHLDPDDPEHLTRLEQGDFKLSPHGFMSEAGFSAILKKGTRVRDNEEFFESYLMMSDRFAGASEISKEISVYTGDKRDPCWTDTEPQHFKRLCVVHGDISKVSCVASPGIFGSIVYMKKMSMVLRYGPEIQAQISWVEDGEEKRGPAQLIYDDVSSGAN